MKPAYLITLLVTLLTLTLSIVPGQGRRLSGNYFLVANMARQVAPPYPAAGLRPEVPFTLPTEQQASGDVPEMAAAQPVEDDEDEAVEDLDPIAADAAEDDTEELLPMPEERVSARAEDVDENADIIPERQAGPTPSKRYWFFRK
ncbi:unnamed protein product [Ceratitis capitata]|uniref:(Mediterranean fruit fly) hypothetical protein n=2 Tax=Ceratitis capitata TaxID=7213 RepID=A0A811V109_CERCA|nr:unnamed protein product [Ceratitis capitata]